MRFLGQILILGSKKILIYCLNVVEKYLIKILYVMEAEYLNFLTNLFPKTTALNSKHFA